MKNVNNQSQICYHNSLNLSFNVCMVSEKKATQDRTACYKPKKEWGHLLQISSDPTTKTISILSFNFSCCRFAYIIPFCTHKLSLKVYGWYESNEDSSYQLGTVTFTWPSYRESWEEENLGCSGSRDNET